MSALRMTFAQNGISDLMTLENASGEFPMRSMLSDSSFSRTSGRLARISHSSRRIGAPNQRKLLCSNHFWRLAESPDADRL